jgi:anti-anti-sigma factor
VTADDVGGGSDLVVHVDGSRAGYRVRILGDLDARSAAKLASALEPLAGPVVIDCSELRFVDSTGIGVIVHAHRRLARNGHTLEMREVTAACLRILETLGLAGMLRAEPGQGAAGR